MRFVIRFVGCAWILTTVGCVVHETHRSLEPLRVASYRSNYTGPKLTVALGKIANKSPYMNGLLATDADRLGNQAKEILKTHLTQSGRFDVLDRANLSEIAAEADLMGRKQQLMGAEVVITGAVTEFGRREVGGRALRGLLGRTKSQIAYAKVSVTVVDAMTSRALCSVQGAGEYELSSAEVLGFGTNAVYDSTLNDKVLNLAVIEVVNELVDRLEGGEWALAE